jgi:hypothetical protein
MEANLSLYLPLPLSLREKCILRIYENMGCGGQHLYLREEVTGGWKNHAR